MELTTNNVWMMICTALVFFMHMGFAFLEIGLTRKKNTINILFKNIFIITTGLLLYGIVGFNLMYPGFAEGTLGVFGFALKIASNVYDRCCVPTTSPLFRPVPVQWPKLIQTRQHPAQRKSCFSPLFTAAQKRSLFFIQGPSWPGR